MKWVHIAIALLGVSLVYGDEDGAAAAERQQRILAAYSTRSILSFTTTTVTSLYTCASAYNGATCRLGRKMRRYKSITEEQDAGADRGERNLDSSLDNMEDITEDKSEGENRDGRIALTVWSTTTTPYTWTSTSINSSTTLSLSYWCSVAGVGYPPACG